MHDACAAANLPSLFYNGSLPEAVEELGPAFQAAFGEQNRGSLLNDMAASGSTKSADPRVAVAAKLPSPNNPAFLLVKEHLDAPASGLSVFECLMYGWY